MRMGMVDMAISNQGQAIFQLVQEKELLEARVIMLESGLDRIAEIGGVGFNRPPADMTVDELREAIADLAIALRVSVINGGSNVE